MCGWKINLKIQSFAKSLWEIQKERYPERQQEGEKGKERGSTQWALVGSQYSHVVNPSVFPKAGNTDHWGAQGRAGVCSVSEP